MNLVATLVLSRADRESLNVRGAFLHVATDLAAFAGTAVAGALVLATGLGPLRPDRRARRRRALPALELVAAARLRAHLPGGRRRPASTRTRSPRALAADPDVVEVHDLHVWTVTSGFPALAAHVLVSPETDCHGARRRLQQLLHDRYQLHHVTLQVDHVAQRSQPVEIASRRGGT